jgi:spermine oxidase
MSSYSVAVVGAGIAGLSACVRLLENGIKNIILIEASDRIGGRINTIPYGI